MESSSPNLTVVLASCNKAVIRSVRSAVKARGHSHLQVCKKHVQVIAQLNREEELLVLLDVAEANDRGEFEGLAHSTSSNAVFATLSWGDSLDYRMDTASLGHGVVEHLQLPHDLSKLDALMAAAPTHNRDVEMTDPSVRAQTEKHLDSFTLMALGTKEIVDQLQRVIPQDTTLLLTGETGTGKTRLARLIHDLSPRRQEPFLVVDCGAVSASLIESEMFGHVKGAFTGADRDRLGKFAAAGHGTLLLDEINSLPLPLQGKLLRAVDDRIFEPVGSERGQPLHARVIAATNARLDDEVAAGRFRADLYFRINVVGFFLSPLRDRRDLIAPLANKFLTEIAARNRPDVRGATREALDALQVYSWPGNIRELRNVIERAVALCPGPEVQLDDVQPALNADKTAMSTPGSGQWSESPSLLSATTTLMDIRAEVEKIRINEVLAKHGNNRRRAAAELGICRMALYNKLHKYGLMGPGYRAEA